MKNMAKRALASVLCLLMLLSAFAVIPATAEEQGTKSTETTRNLIGVENLASGAKVNFSDYDPQTMDTTAEIQLYVWQKTGMYFTNATGTNFSTAPTMVKVGDTYALQFNQGGTYVNKATLSGSSYPLGTIAQLKTDTNDYIIDLLYSESGPLNYSLDMEFIIPEDFGGSAESNDGTKYAYTKHRGYSLVDFGGGWIVKATAPGAGALELVPEVGSSTPALYALKKNSYKDYINRNDPSYNTTDYDGSSYYKVKSVGEGDADKGYLYSYTYKGNSAYAAYVFDQDSGMGWSNDETVLGRLADDEKELKSGSTFWVKSRASATIDYKLIDGDTSNGEAFAYTAGDPFTLRFFFERTPVAGANNDDVYVTIYGVTKDGDKETLTLVGEKTYKTSADVYNYGVRINDLNTTKTQLVSMQLNIPEDATYICKGDHSVYLSDCKVERIENSDDKLSVRYDCGHIEYVHTPLADGIADLTAGKSVFVQNSMINGTGRDNSKFPIGRFTMTTTLTVYKDNYDPAKNYAPRVVARVCGINMLNFATFEDGKGYFYTSETSNTTEAPAINAGGIKKVFEIPKPTSNKTYTIEFVIYPKLSKSEDHKTEVYIDKALVATLNTAFYSESMNVNNFKIDEKAQFAFSNTRIATENDFVVAGQMFLDGSGKAPTNDTVVLRVNNADVLTYTADGKLVTPAGVVVCEKLKPINPNDLFVRFLPSNGGFYAVYYSNDGEKVATEYIKTDTSQEKGLTITSPEGVTIKNVKVANLSSGTGVPAAITSTPVAPEVPCLHRDANQEWLTDEYIAKSLAIIPSPNKTSSGAWQGVYDLYYAYDCHLCGEKMYVSLGENLYNSTKDEYKAYKYSKSATNSSGTKEAKTNATFNGDGVYDFTKTEAFFVYTNENIVKSGGKAFWVNFTFRFETIDPKGIIEKGKAGGGGNLFNVNANYASLLRVFAVAPKDKNGYPLTDSTKPADAVIYDPRAKVENCDAGEAGVDYSTEYILIRSNTNSVQYALVKAGDVLNFTFHIKPGVNNGTKLWLNGNKVLTTTINGTNTADNGYALRFLETSTYFTGSLNNFAYVLDDMADMTAEHTHTDAYDNSALFYYSDTTLNRVYDCYCGAHVTEQISGIVKNNIENFYNGYGKVDYTAPTGRYYIDSDITVKGDVKSGALITLGADVVLDASELDVPTTVNALVEVDGTAYELYIDGVHKKSGTLTETPSFVTFGADRVYGGYVVFKYNKIVTLGTKACADEVAFTDNLYGAICYHENSALNFAGQTVSTVTVDGETFNDDSDVKGLKHLKARYVCTECGQAVYAIQDKVIHNDQTLINDTLTPFPIDENGNGEADRNRVVYLNFDDISEGNQFWVSFDYTYSHNSGSINTLIARGARGGSIVAMMVPDIQAGYLERENNSDRYSYLNLLRGYAVLRPDAEKNGDGKYTVEDYYTDRLGLCNTGVSEAFDATDESVYMAVFKSGETYKIDVCLWARAEGGLNYATYIDGQLFYKGYYTAEDRALKVNRDDTVPADIKFGTHGNGTAKTTADIVDAETYTDRFAPSMRFFDQAHGIQKVENLSIVKFSGGVDSYLNTETIVFEMTVTKPETAGALATLGETEILSVDADGKLIAADGQAITVKNGEAYEDVILGETELYVTAVLGNGQIRYYVGEIADEVANAYVGGEIYVTVAPSDADLASGLTTGAGVKVRDVQGSVGNEAGEYISFQPHVNDANQIRVVGAYDHLYFNAVGFRLRTTSGEDIVETVRKTNTVFFSITEDDDSVSVVTADLFNHRYFSLLEMYELNHPAADTEYDIYVTPFTVVGVDGEPVYSEQTAKIHIIVGSEAAFSHSFVPTNEVPDATAYAELFGEVLEPVA